MFKTNREKLKERAKLIRESRQMVDRASQEKRDLTPTEQERFDNHMLDIDRLGREAHLERVNRANMSELEYLRMLEKQLSYPMGPRTMQGDPMNTRGDNYSLINIIRANVAAREGRAGAWDIAERELAISQDIARQLGRDPQGLFVPMSALGLDRRDLTVGTPTAGGYMVGTDTIGFIELLRNKMVVRRAGATVMGNLVGDVEIPKQTGAATAYWLGEGGAPTESQQTIGQVALSPKTVGAYTDISRKLLKQSSIDAEMFVRDDLATILALAIDLAALHGTGAGNQPLGVAGVSGIGSVVGGTDGAAPDWADIVDLESELAVDNADLGRLGYITNSKVRSKLKQTLVTATYGDKMVWSETNNTLNGFPAHVSNQVSSTLDKGTSTGVCSAIFFGNWADLIIGMWGVLDILVDPYTGGTSGTVRIVAMQDVDIAVRHPESFAAMLDALTT